MVRVKSCCGCASVRTGTLIIAWLGFVLATNIGFPSYYYFANENALRNLCRSKYMSSFYGQGYERYYVTKCLENAPAILTATLSDCFITAIASFLLIFGVMKKNDVLFYPWLIKVGISVGVMFLVSFSYLFEDFVSFLFSFGISVLAQTLLWLVVYSHFQEIKKGMQNLPIHAPGIQIQPTPYDQQFQPLHHVQEHKLPPYVLNPQK